MISAYPDLDAVLARASQHGRRFVFGHSVQGRPLVGFELPGSGPLVTVTAGLHGLEYIGVATALEVLEAGPLAGARLVVLPVLNPDGYARTWEAGGHGRIRDLRKNARGVDLNRNFPLPYDAAAPTWVPGAGSMDPDAATYRGPSVLSEPEAAGSESLPSLTQ